MSDQPPDATSVRVRQAGELRPHQLVGKHAIAGRRQRVGAQMAANHAWARKSRVVVKPPDDA